MSRISALKSYFLIENRPSVGPRYADGMTAELRATPQEAKRLVWTSTLSVVTVFYCFNVTPIDWLYVCVSALVGVLSVNYWRYPVTGLRLLMDIAMALVSVTCIFTTAWAVSAWGQLVLFGCGLFCFGISSYAWRLPYPKSKKGPHSPPIFLTPYWSYFHATFHFVVLFPVNRLIQYRSKAYSYEAYMFSIIGLLSIATVRFIWPNLVDNVMVGSWKSKDNN